MNKDSLTLIWVKEEPVVLTFEEALKLKYGIEWKPGNSADLDYRDKNI